VLGLRTEKQGCPQPHAKIDFDRLSKKRHFYAKMAFFCLYNLFLLHELFLPKDVVG